MSAIVLARHGKTDLTESRRLHGENDMSINLEGQENVARMAIELKRNRDVRIRRVVCSDSGRAYQSALVIRLVLDIPMNIIRDERLRECNIGRLEGLSIDEAQNLTKKEFHTPDALFPFDFRPWGGEDYLTVLTRHLTAIVDHSYGLPNGDLAHMLVVGHCWGLGAVLYHFRQPSLMSTGSYRLLRL